jgi:hypothetical protein
VFSVKGQKRARASWALADVEEEAVDAFASIGAFLLGPTPALDAAVAALT